MVLAVNQQDSTHNFKSDAQQDSTPEDKTTMVNLWHASHKGVT